MNRPTFKRTSVEKIFRYFFGETWLDFDCIELAVRAEHNRINFFDDEIYVYNKKRDTAKTFNWNTDPSAYFMRGESKSILRPGVHFYKLSYHHIWNNAKRYVALRPNTAGERLPTFRTDKAGRLYASTGVAIDQHAGAETTTGSEGCQTAPRSQYPEFIQFIGDALGVRVPLGVQRKAEQRFQQGIGNIPYILITQQQFDYILSLDESEFDSEKDLKYQIANFVNVPKIAVVKPVVSEIPDATEILNSVLADEPDENEDIDLDLSNGVPPQTNPSASFDNAEADADDIADADSDASASKTEQKAGQIINNGADLSNEGGNEKDNPFVAYIPNSNDLKKLFYKAIAGASVANFLAPFLNLPVWLQVALAVILVLLVAGFVFTLIYNRKFIFEFIQRSLELRADRTKNSPLLTTEKPEIHEQVPRPLKRIIGEKK